MQHIILITVWYILYRHHWHRIFKYSVYLYLIVARQNRQPLIYCQCCFKSNCLQEKNKPTKENISELLSGNKLILKPPLKIDVVIEHLTSNKNNIEVVNLSSSDFDQMLLSGKAPKIAVEFNNNNVDNSDYFTTSTFNNVIRSEVGNFFIMHETYVLWGIF